MESVFLVDVSVKMVSSELHANLNVIIVECVMIMESVMSIIYIEI